MVMFQEFYDLSLELAEDLPVWPGDESFELSPLARLAQGDGANVSTMKASLHLGTHLDPPGHFAPQGGFIDSIPVERFILPAVVVDVPDHRDAGPEDFSGLDLQGKAVILRTANTGRDIYKLPGFHSDFRALNPSGAEALIQAGAALVGIDYLSIERETKQGEGGPDMAVHKLLCRSGMLILEGLDLSGLPCKGLDRGWTLICLPLKIKDGDGGPCRAVLVR